MQVENSLIHVAEGTGAGTARIAARSARTGGGCGRGRSFGRDGENRELWLEFLAMAFGALGLVFSVNESFKLMLALFADVLVDGHGGSEFSVY